MTHNKDAKPKADKHLLAALDDLLQPAPPKDLDVVILNTIQAKIVQENRADIFQLLAKDPQAISQNALPESLITPVALYHAISADIKADVTLSLEERELRQEALIKSMSENILAGANSAVQTASSTATTDHDVINQSPDTGPAA